MPKQLSLEVETAKLIDGQEIIWRDRLHEDEIGIAGGKVGGMMLVSHDEAEYFDFPEEESDDRMIFDSLRAYGRVLELLVAAGHVTEEKIEQARKIAMTMK